MTCPLELLCGNEVSQPDLFFYRVVAILALGPWKMGALLL